MKRAQRRHTEKKGEKERELEKIRKMMIEKYEENLRPLCNYINYELT